MAKWARPEKELGGVFEPAPMVMPVFTPNPIPAAEPVKLPELVPALPSRRQ